MKKHLLFAFALLLMASCSPKQSGTATPDVASDSLLEVGPYTVNIIDNNIWHIQDYNKENPAGEHPETAEHKASFNNCSDMYLLVGEKEALLIDLSNQITWFDSAETHLRKVVKDIAGDRPLNIAFTHNHGDHTGMLPAFIGSENTKFYFQRKDFEEHKDKIPQIQYEFYDEGFSFDIGGIVVKTILVPGHTHGSMVFDIVGRNILLTGDAIGSGHGVWIFNKEGFQEYQQGVPHLIAYVDNSANGIDTTQLRIYGGHYWQKDWLSLPEGKELGNQYLRDMEKLLNKMQSGEAHTEPSNLNFKHLDTYFREGSAIVVWNHAEATEYFAK